MRTLVRSPLKQCKKSTNQKGTKCFNCDLTRLCLSYVCSRVLECKAEVTSKDKNSIWKCITLSKTQMGVEALKFLTRSLLFRISDAQQREGSSTVPITLQCAVVLALRSSRGQVRRSPADRMSRWGNAQFEWQLMCYRSQGQPVTCR